MKTSFKTQKDFFIRGWFTYVLYKLDLADENDIHPAMWTKIRIHEIEYKISKPWHVGNIEKDLNLEEGALEREPETKS